jgi:putative oxidoreductase
MKFLDKYTDHTYALLRIVSGLLFMGHGIQKFFNFPTEFPYPLNPMSMAAGGIEVVGGAAIAIGLFTRPVAFLASGMAAIGYWLVHGTQGMFPIANGGEIIALYCFIFLYVAAKGAGIWSLDGMRSNPAD